MDDERTNESASIDDFIEFRDRQRKRTWSADHIARTDRVNIGVVRLLVMVGLPVMFELCLRRPFISDIIDVIRCLVYEAQAGVRGLDMYERGLAARE